MQRGWGLSSAHFKLAARRNKRPIFIAQSRDHLFFVMAVLHVTAERI